MKTKKKLINAAFYYEGTGYYIQEGAEKIIQGFDKAYSNFLQDVEKNGIEFYYEQLEQILEFSKEENLDESTICIWMMDVYFLTKAGYIKGDDKNGMLYFYSN